MTDAELERELEKALQAKNSAYDALVLKGEKGKGPSYEEIYDELARANTALAALYRQSVRLAAWCEASAESDRREAETERRRKQT